MYPFDPLLCLMQTAQKQLIQAEEHFYNCRLVEAYHIFRRYFDRIPFKIEEDHAKFIGMFIRTLTELGKTNELNFYVSALEAHYKKNQSAVIGFPLAMVYYSLPEPSFEAAKTIFEKITLDPAAKDYVARSKMMLACYYDWKKKDLGLCRRLIFSIETDEPQLKNLVDIWKIKILKDEKKLVEAEELLTSVLRNIDRDAQWYPYYCVKIIEGSLSLEKGDFKKTREIVQHVRELYDQRQFKSLKTQLEDLERRIREKSEVGVMTVEFDEDNQIKFIYESRSLKLKKFSPSETLLSLFTKKGFLDKELIINALYSRGYAGADDDRLVYYHIHALRKRLKGIGLPDASITNEEAGYRFHPKVELVESEHRA